MLITLLLLLHDCKVSVPANEVGSIGSCAELIECLC